MPWCFITKPLCPSHHRAGDSPPVDSISSSRAWPPRMGSFIVAFSSRGGALQAVMDRGPLGSARRALYRDPVEAGCIGLVQALVKNRCVGLRIGGHRNGKGGSEDLRDPEIRATPNRGQFGMIHEHERGAGAVMPGMLAR